MLGTILGTAAGVVMRTEPLRIFTELGRHPRLLRSWLPFAGMLLYRGVLPRRDTELVILRTAWTTGNRYEWVQHARLAQQAGLDEAAIVAAADGPAAPGWTDRQQVILEAVDDLHRDGRLADDTHRRVLAVLEDREIIELCALVGAYAMLAMILATQGVQPEPKALAALSTTLRDMADQLHDGESRTA